MDEFEDKTISAEPEIIERPGDSLISEVTESNADTFEEEPEVEEEESTEDTEEDDGISVDEYGTEWYEDEVSSGSELEVLINSSSSMEFSSQKNKSTVRDCLLSEQMKAARNRLKSLDLQSIQRGVVSGITGFLLSEGDRLNLDITALLSEASPMYPDVRAAAVAIEAITEMTGKEIPLSKMLENARSIEQSVQEIIESATPLLPSPDEEINDPSFG